MCRCPPQTPAPPRRVLRLDRNTPNRAAEFVASSAERGSSLHCVSFGLWVGSSYRPTRSPPGALGPFRAAVVPSGHLGQGAHRPSSCCGGHPLSFSQVGVRELDRPYPPSPKCRKTSARHRDDTFSLPARHGIHRGFSARCAEGNKLLVGSPSRRLRVPPPPPPISAAAHSTGTVHRTRRERALDPGGQLLGVAHTAAEGHVALWVVLASSARCCDDPRRWPSGRTPPTLTPRALRRTVQGLPAAGSPGQPGHRATPMSLRLLQDRRTTSFGAGTTASRGSRARTGCVVGCRPTAVTAGRASGPG